MDEAVVSARGVGRWQRGHPWIFRSDLVRRPDAPAGVVRVQDQQQRPLGIALWSPASEISLRLLDRDASASIDVHWWRARLGQAIERRRDVAPVATAYRLVHAEADACPSLVCDRYDACLVLQLMSAGLEACRADILEALTDLTQPSGVLARNDVSLRAREHLPVGVELLAGEVPHEIEIVEHGIRMLAAPWTGQKTGAFLDQRENRALVGRVARGRALDCFSYHGSFALHLARRAEHVIALDVSAEALARGAENARRNDIGNIEFVEGDTFEFLRAQHAARLRFDTIVLDPPAFAKSRATVSAAVRGYKEINLRAMRLLTPGGLLFTASCSFHLGKPLFLEMLHAAAADSGRRVAIRELTGQPVDHPEVLTIPETGYLKGALLEALD